jgi:SRSO17 transposase
VRPEYIRPQTIHQYVAKKSAKVASHGKSLIVDGMALPEHGKHSIGIKQQHCGVLSNQAKCQWLGSLTLAEKEAPVPITLRLHLPKYWAQVDAALADGVHVDMLLTDAGYGSSADFRVGRKQRGLQWAVGVQPRSIPLTPNSGAWLIPRLGDLPSTRDLRHHVCRLCDD